MIPLRDINPTRSTPIVTYALIAINVAVFLYQVSLGPAAGQHFLMRFGMVPHYLTQAVHRIRSTNRVGDGSGMAVVASGRWSRRAARRGASACSAGGTAD